MQCPQCRHAIPDGSRFCNACGAVLSNLPVSPAPSLPQTDETVIAVLRPSFLFVGVRYGIAVVLTILAVVAAAFVASLEWWFVSAAAPWVATGFSLLVFLNPIFHHISRQFETYTITTQKVEIRSGIFSRTQRNIPLPKVQDVTTQATLGKRMLGLGDLIIDSASEGGKIRLKNIAAPQTYADEILRRLRR